jgi:hypothetical protein
MQGGIIGHGRGRGRGSSWPSEVRR